MNSLAAVTNIGIAFAAVELVVTSDVSSAVVTIIKQSTNVIYLCGNF